MKPKDYVTIALIITFIIAGCIFIFGLVGTKSFFWAFLAFSIISLGFIILAIRNFLSRSDIIVLMCLFLLISVGVSIYVTSLREYGDMYKVIETNKVSLTSQLDMISQNNQYYIDYADYLQKIENSINLTLPSPQVKIVTVYAPQNDTVIQPQNPIVPIYMYEYDDNVREREEDDD